MALNSNAHAPVVFLGPSLATDDARQLLEADYRPPVRRGDLDALPDGAVAGIIDGMLEPEMRVPPDEVRRAIDRNIGLFGASSTGALLAATLNDPRMTGIGRVYEFICAYPYAGDDLISVLFAEPGAKPLSVPLIHVVLGVLDLAKERGVSNLEVGALIRSLRSLPLAKRTSPSILARLRDTHCLPHDFLCSLTLRDYKRCDARRLLEHLAKILR